MDEERNETSKIKMSNYTISRMPFFMRGRRLLNSRLNIYTVKNKSKREIRSFPFETGTQIVSIQIG